MDDYGMTLATTPGQGETASTLQAIDWGKMPVEPLNKYIVKVAEFLPDLLIALRILVVGWVLGRILQIVVAMLLQAIGFDKFAKKTGIAEILSEGDEKVVPHRWFGALTFWVVIFVSVILSLDQLRLSIASYRLDQLVQFVLTVVTVLVILIFGMILNLVSSRIIRTTAQSAKVPQTQLYLNLMKWLVLVFTLIACLIQIGLPSQMIFMAVAAVFVTLCITFVIAFGIGGAGWAAKVLDRTLREDGKK